MNNKKSFHTLVLLLTVFLLTFTSVFAQAGPINFVLEKLDVENFPTIVLEISTWDQYGLPLGSLTTEDFKISENSGTQFSPDNVIMLDDTDISLVMVLDISGSMVGKPLNDAKIAATRLVDRLSNEDQIALLAFSGPLDPDPAILDPDHELGFGSDRAQIYDTIDALEARGETHLFEAVSKAVRLSAQGPEGHRSILLLSDGRNDPLEAGDAQDSIDLAKENQVPVFVIGLGSDTDEEYLMDLATQTGGVYRSAPSSSELATIFTDMITLMKTRYQISYNSSIAEAIDNYDVEITFLPYTQVRSISAPVSIAQPTEVVPTPTQAEKQEVIAQPTAVDQPGSQEADTGTVEQPKTYLFVILIVVFLAIILLLGLVTRARKNNKQITKQIAKEVCGQCGYDLTGTSGSCPQCGSDRRI